MKLPKHVLVNRILEGYKAFSRSFSVTLDFSAATDPTGGGATKLEEGSDPATMAGDPR